MSLNTIDKQGPSYVDTKINRDTVMDTIKKRRHRRAIRGTTVPELARGIRRAMNAHPSCTRKIQEILERLISEGLVVHRGYIRVATRKERMESSTTPMPSTARKVHKIKKRNDGGTVVLPLDLSLVNKDEAEDDKIEDKEPEAASPIPAVWAEFSPDTPPNDERLLAACGISA